MIPVCQPTLIGNVKKYVNECIDTNWISSNGRFIDEFEKAYATYCGVEYGVACSSGTAALHLALKAIGVGEGDEVIVPTFTMIATTNAIYYTGAKPVYVDSDIETWNIDVTKIEEKITAKTKAIIIVHTYGNPCDMDKVNEVAKKYNIKVIEDAAEAHGATYKEKKVGGLSDVSCFSFYGNKIITTGEGGMVVSRSKAISEKCKSLRNHAFTIPRFQHWEIGYNYRMTNIQAAIGLAQLEKIETLVQARIDNAWFYTEALLDVDGITTPPDSKFGKNVYWMYGILVDKKAYGMGKEQLIEELYEKGIQTRSFFFPTHKQPAYPKCEEEFPVAQQLWEQGLYLPSASNLTRQHIRAITNRIMELRK